MPKLTQFSINMRNMVAAALERKRKRRSLEVPPDPDGQNRDRTRWALAAITAFRMQTGTEQDDAIPDLLCDLMHLADSEGLIFDAELNRAKFHYRCETGQEIDV